MVLRKRRKTHLTPYVEPGNYSQILRESQLPEILHIIRDIEILGCSRIIENNCQASCYNDWSCHEQQHSTPKETCAVRNHPYSCHNGSVELRAVSVLAHGKTFSGYVPVSHRFLNYILLDFDSAGFSGYSQSHWNACVFVFNLILSCSMR